jgi:2-oxoglutarate dehydrogenase E1 component
MKDFSYVMSAHPAYIESMYNDYLKDASSVDPEWKKFFEGFDFAVSRAGESLPGGQTAIPEGQLAKELQVYNLITAYRKRGHLVASTNPIRKRKDRKARLSLEDHGLSDADLNTKFFAGHAIGMPHASLKEIIEKLTSLYASGVGIQYSYINNSEKYNWVEKAYEAMMQEQIPLPDKKRILEKLNEGVIFEKFLHTKYIGQKRFSLEGGESTIPALDTIINKAADTGIKEVVIGMAHRGRLNVLANILRKTYEQIFSEFEGNMPEDTTMGSGDVKYHLGFRSNIKTISGKEINVQLTPNPSHLEVVNPVVAGFSRAKADVLYNGEYDKILPILIHGDAAVAGQGVVYELLQMSCLPGYDVGGTIHIVINNQIGFTTDFDDARSADYCTSIAAMVHAPVLHVNGDDPESVVKACQFAVAYRQKFLQDIFIDIVCYRKHGHNEGDDPSFTQPLMYELIKSHPDPRKVYTEYLLKNGESGARELAEEMEKRFWNDLQQRLDEVKQKTIPYQLQAPEQAWKELRHAKTEDFKQSPETAISKEQVKSLFDKIMYLPESFTPQSKIKKLLNDKIKMFEKDQKLDWATCELLAYASLLAENKPVRMSGQDVQRGTFSHRHAVLHDEKNYKEYNRLNNVNPSVPFRIYNSLLSEFAVLGFEYGYSIADPDSLTIWEAQFGDFANGAQTVIDQYITTAETKWQKMSGLVLLLPHGYEGQGPEHSSARIERFLQLASGNNIVVTNITTGANFFHMFRRQLHWPFRKPLVNFSPKANLRLDKAYAHIDELTTGGFKEVIDDPYIKSPSKVKKLLLCSGKIYYDLSERQMKENRTDVAIVRLEQIYPLPIDKLEAIRKRYKNAEWVWVQEEPRNQGALSFLKMNLMDEFPMRAVSRPASAATATGFSKLHAKEQEAIITEAFSI